MARPVRTARASPPQAAGWRVRRLSREAFAQEAGATLELVDRLVDVGAIQPLPDGEFDSREEVVASTARAILDAGVRLEDVAWALDSGRFGIRSLGAIFSEPTPRTAERYAELASALGDSAELLPSVYAAFGIPEPEPDDHPRVDEAELVIGFVRLWSLVDPGGEAHVRVARLVGDATRRIAEGWLDVWDEVAEPSAITQGAPTIGKGPPLDPTDPDQNPSIGMAALGRRLVSLVHERQVEATLHARIIAAIENVLVAADRIPRTPERPPAIAFVDLAGFTSLTEQHGDEVAAESATRLQELAEVAARRGGGRIVKLLGDGVLMRFDSSETAIRSTLALVVDIGTAGLPPARGGIAAGRVVVRDGDVFGRVVNLAARIAAHVGPGEVGVEEGVVVALPRGTARFDPIGRVPLKGFAEPVALWRASAPGRQP